LSVKQLLIKARRSHYSLTSGATSETELNHVVLHQ
jgi:hypothetical protein